MISRLQTCTYIIMIIIIIIIFADLSRNKLVEVPGECTRYQSLERLLLYHNTIKTIPDNIVTLHSLTYLDIRYTSINYNVAGHQVYQH